MDENVGSTPIKGLEYIEDEKWPNLDLLFRAAVIGFASR